MLAFWGDNEALTAAIHQKDRDTLIDDSDRDTLIDDSVILIKQSLGHYYSNIAVTKSQNTLKQQTIKWRQSYSRLKN